MTANDWRSWLYSTYGNTMPGNAAAPAQQLSQPYGNPQWGWTISLPAQPAPVPLVPDEFDSWVEEVRRQNRIEELLKVLVKHCVEEKDKDKDCP